MVREICKLNLSIAQILLSNSICQITVTGTKFYLNRSSNFGDRPTHGDRTYAKSAFVSIIKLATKKSFNRL